MCSGRCTSRYRSMVKYALDAELVKSMVKYAVDAALVHMVKYALDAQLVMVK